MSGWLRVRLILDRLIAVVVAVLLAPVVAVLAVLIRRHDGGPGLITVARVGRSGRPFAMWKLRSMRVASADGTAGGPGLTSATDDRITPIGRHLRRFHLDELPQLLNVARGEMALLGPRPESPDFVDRDDPRWVEVLEAPPGIAGPTQVIVNDWEREVISGPDGIERYRHDVLPVKLAIDRWYVQSSSPLTDVLVGWALLGRFVPGGLPDVLSRIVPPAIMASVGRAHRDLVDAAVCDQGSDPAGEASGR